VEAVPLIATFVGLVWLTWRRNRGPRTLSRAVHDNFDVDATVAIHVAHREATERNLPVTAIHLLYGLLQVESFTAALAKLELDAAAIEQRAAARRRERRVLDEAVLHVDVDERHAAGFDREVDHVDTSCIRWGGERLIV
jgi:hypothetical protein